MRRGRRWEARAREREEEKEVQRSIKEQTADTTSFVCLCRTRSIDCVDGKSGLSPWCLLCRIFSVCWISGIKIVILWLFSSITAVWNFRTPHRGEMSEWVWLDGKLSLAARFHCKTCETCQIVRILREEEEVLFPVCSVQAAASFFKALSSSSPLCQMWKTTTLNVKIVSDTQVAFVL